ncbi:MAG: hypothetical protein U9O97_00935 [Elusimicrobiota bacterium]|nr:hypothetical protein [Elusimicrobiota bacterium]
MNVKKVLLFFVLLSSFVFASDNPFVAAKKKSGVVSFVKSSAFAGKIVSKIAPVQQKLNKKLSKLTRDIKEEPSTGALFLVFFAAFAYGVIHAIGPGHGKTLIFTYFISEGGSIKKGIAAAFTVAVLHSVSAIVVVTSLYFFMKHSYMSFFENFSSAVKFISYPAIAVIGLVLFIKALRGSGRRPGISGEKARGDLLPLAFSVGIIPCPGATIILIFSASMNFLIMGVVLAMVMSLGMAVTISSVAVAAVLSQKGLGDIIKENELRGKVGKGMEIAGSFLIFLMGVLLFIGNL